jgi:FG-GAP repeat
LRHQRNKNSLIIKMKQLFSLLLLLILCSTTATRAQIGMGGQPHSSAVLDLKSPANDKAFYPPRLTTAQRNAIVNPQAGAFVYDPEKATIFLYDGQSWLPLATTDAGLLAPVNRTASDGDLGDSFGTSVAISGDYAVVGAPKKQIGSNSEQGAVYVFVRSGNSWVQQAKLTASDGAANNQFGNSVSISGDYIVVGSANSSGFTGSAYVFVRSGSTWTQKDKLTASDGAAGDGFGYSVAISGDYAIIGARFDDIGSYNDQGSAYIFKLTVLFGGGASTSFWNQQAKLIASDGFVSDYFGNSVAISGNYAIVGSIYDYVSSTQEGSAFVFLRTGNTWAQQAKLTATDGAAGKLLGASVAISGDYAVVGAAGDDIGSNNAQGSAYVFLRTGTTWSQQAKIIDGDGAALDRFGYSVAISGDYIVVGARDDDIGSNTDQGSAYVLKRSGTNWTRVRKITDNSSEYAQNGISVGLSNGTFIIGAPVFRPKGKVGFGTVD